MAHSPNLLPLKVLVISLGLVLLGGGLFILVAIAQKTAPLVPAPQVHCLDATVHMGDNGTLASVTPQGDTLQLVLGVDKTVKVMTVNRCTGKVLQTLTLTP